jgi:hypothetical protein
MLDTNKSKTETNCSLTRSSVEGVAHSIEVDEILTTGRIPALSGDEMEALCRHLFALTNRDQRITIAEIAYHNHDDPQALNIFLACTVPMAQRMTKRKAERVFTIPTDWQLEAMYGGAVSFLLEMFEAHRPLQPVVSNPFARYLMRTILHGAMNPFRIRQEHWNIEGVEDVALLERIRYHDPAERELITRDLMEQVTTFPYLREEQAQLLKTIASLGPEKALRDKGFRSRYSNGEHDRARQYDKRIFRDLLDLTGIANAMGVDKQKVKNLLKDARKILRDVFNHNGRLFAA